MINTLFTFIPIYIPISNGVCDMVTLLAQLHLTIFRFPYIKVEQYWFTASRFQEMLGFQTDRSVDVRKFVVTFIEEARLATEFLYWMYDEILHHNLNIANFLVTFCFSKKDPDILPRIIGNLTMMLQDDSVQVAKKVILCMGQIYKIAFEVRNEQIETSNHTNTSLSDANGLFECFNVLYCVVLITTFCMVCAVSGLPRRRVWTLRCVRRGSTSSSCAVRLATC